MAFNFLSGQSMQDRQAQPYMQQNPQMMQIQQMLQQQAQAVPGANVAQWAQNPMAAAQLPNAQLAGNQTQPGYAQNPLSNQGANGFSLSDYLQRAQASGFSPQMALGGLQMMLKGWGSHS